MGVSPSEGKSLITWGHWTRGALKWQESGVWLRGARARAQAGPPPRCPPLCTESGREGRRGDHQLSTDQQRLLWPASWRLRPGEGRAPASDLPSPASRLACPTLPRGVSPCPCASVCRGPSSVLSCPPLWALWLSCLPHGQAQSGGLAAHLWSELCAQGRRELCGVAHRGRRGAVRASGHQGTLQSAGMHRMLRPGSEGPGPPTVTSLDPKGLRSECGGFVQRLPS